MPSYRIKKPIYPQEKIEYHIKTATGVLCKVFEDKDLALARFATCDPSWKLIEVTLTKNDITPVDHELTAPLQLHMSQVLVG